MIVLAVQGQAVELFAEQADGQLTRLPATDDKNALYRLNTAIGYAAGSKVGRLELYGAADQLMGPNRYN